MHPVHLKWAAMPKVQTKWCESTGRFWILIDGRRYTHYARQSEAMHAAANLSDAECREILDWMDSDT